MAVIDLVDVDEIWRSLGTWGKFQRRHIIVYLTTLLPWVFHGLTIVFIGYRPDFECRKVAADIENTTANNDSAWRQYQSCTIQHYTNVSGEVKATETGCTNGYVYDIPTKESFVTEWDLVCETAELAELTQAMMSVGQMVGAVVFTGIADRVGRKPVTVLCHIALLAVTIGTAFSPDYTVFVVLRILTGAIQQGMGLPGATLAIECLPKEVRSYTETIGLLMWTTAICTMAPIAYLLRNVSWRYVQLTFALTSTWSLFQWWLHDESLRWLIANNKLKEAKRVLQKACKENGKDYGTIAKTSGFAQYEQQLMSTDHLICINKQDKTEKENNTDELLNPLNDKLEVETKLHVGNGDIKAFKYTAIDILRRKRLLVTSLICWYTWITVDLSYYGIYFISASLAGDRFLNFFLTAVVEYPAALLQYLTINRFGRKKTVICFLTIAAVDLIIATVLITTADGRAAYLTASTVFVMIGKMGVTGAYSTIFIYTFELYPTNMRNQGAGMAAASSRLGGFIAIFLRPLAEIALWAPCAIFAGMCGIVVLLIFCLPETMEYELPQTVKKMKSMYKHEDTEHRTATSEAEN